jgi:hypothetical protein
MEDSTPPVLSKFARIPGAFLMNIVLLRVGIDTGSGGILGPIFANDKFEFVPIGPADYDAEGRTYGNTKGRHGRTLIQYFPSGRLKEKMQNEPMHFDPEFKSYTYGDPTRPKQSLKKLQRGDLLVFYAGLKRWGCTTKAALYIIGRFVVEEAGTYTELKQKNLLRLFAKNQHVLNGVRRGERKHLILIKGGRGSKLLKKAVRISALKRARDRGGHPVFVLDPVMKRHFGTFTRLNAIQRSIPRWVKQPEFCDKAAAFVLKLK